MFPNYQPADTQIVESKTKAKTCSVSIKDFMTIAALTFHSVFEGLAVGLEPTSEDVWQLFGGIKNSNLILI